MIRKNLVSISMAVIVVLTSSLVGQSPAQTPSNNQDQTATDQNIALLRKDLRSQKKQIVAANMQLTDKEAEKFWPLFEQYTDELVKINNAKYDAIKQYANNFDTLSDDQAVALARQLLGVDEQVAQLRVRYIPIFGKVISGKKTALFLQLDRRLVMLIDLQLATQIPMIQP